MNKSNNKRKPLLVFSAIILLFAIPIVMARYVYSHQQWLPTHRTNHGQILTPTLMLSQFDTKLKTHGKWLLIFVQTDKCGEGCQHNLYFQRQIQKALGKDTDRLQRVVLTFSADNTQLPIMTWQGALHLQENLEAFQKVVAKPEPWYIVDPLGNIMMSFSATANPDDILADLQHLLEVSTIG